MNTVAKREPPPITGGEIFNMFQKPPFPTGNHQWERIRPGFVTKTGFVTSETTP